MKYRKKPVIIEAFRFGYDKIPEWFSRKNDIGIGSDGEYCLIRTLEGVMRAEKGDWIIRGIESEIYPCKPDIFEKTYEVVE